MLSIFVFILYLFHAASFSMSYEKSIQNAVSFKVKNGSYEQIVKIADALESNDNLLELDMSDLDVGDAGAVKLANMLKKNSTLKILKIQSNKISDYGIKEIVDALHSNKSLKVLDLQRNFITSKSMENLVALMRFNNTLIQIRVHNGGLGQIYRINECVDNENSVDDFIVEYELNMKCMAVSSGLVGGIGSILCDGNDGHEYSGSFSSLGLSAYVNIFFPMSHFHISIRSHQPLGEKTLWKGEVMGLGIGYIMLTMAKLRSDNGATLHFSHMNALAAGIDLAKIKLKLKKGRMSRHAPMYLSRIHKTIKLSSIRADSNCDGL